LAAGNAGCGVIGGPDDLTPSLQVTVRLDTVPAGPGTSEFPLQVRYDLGTNSAGYSLLHVFVTATNLSDEAITGTTVATCHWMFSAYDNVERLGDPLWAESLETPCRLQAFDLNLPPGSSQEFPMRSLPFDSIVGTRGPGTYYLSARLQGRLDGDPPPSKWLTEWIPAGSVELVP
jgi:hypothetical protein